MTTSTTAARCGGSIAPKASTYCRGTRCAPSVRCLRCAGIHTRALSPARTLTGSLYAAADVATSLAEVYQTTRVIDTRANAPTLTAWQPQRRLRLLDLSGTWLLRNTASAALLAAPRSICRRWARAIYTTWPELDGLYVPSTMTGRPNIVLWNAAADSIPTMPSFTRPLTHPLVWSIGQAAAAEIGYRIQ